MISLNLSKVSWVQLTDLDLFYNSSRSLFFSLLQLWQGEKNNHMIKPWLNSMTKFGII